MSEVESTSLRLFLKVVDVFKPQIFKTSTFCVSSHVGITDSFTIVISGGDNFMAQVNCFSENLFQEVKFIFGNS